MKTDRLKSTHYGEIEIGDLSIPCYVLSDGRRVLSGRGLQTAFKLGQTRGSKIPSMVKNKSFQSLINEELKAGVFSPIEFKTNSGLSANGYEATVLVELCDMLLEARKVGLIPEKYIDTAEQAEVLTRAFAKIGILAVIDEATGYQYDREKDELQKLLKAYISEELLPWQKRFPDIFYKELFRLNGWDFTVKGIKKRPGVVGKWTNKLIYEQLPPNILSEIKKKTPKSKNGKYTAKFHQSLTTDVGHPNLTAQINQIITLFQLSDNMQQMWSQFEKLNQRKMGQLSLPFDFNKEGQTIEPIEEEKLTTFDKNMTKALNFNPKKG